MRAQDLAELERPYAGEAAVDERFANALGVLVPSVRELQREVLADLDDKNYGVGWWAPHPGTSRRILIADHMLQCIASIETNLVEANLHLIELRDFGAREDQILALAVTHDQTGKVRLGLLPREKPSDDLPRLMADLHIGGFFRAVGSALDCLGAAIIGVLALRTSLKKADFDRAQSALDRLTTPATDGERLQADFKACLSKLVADSGPPDWRRWAADYRNMLMHRGRRLQSMFVRPATRWFSHDKVLASAARAIRQLPQDPHLSDIESLFGTASRAPVLTEDAMATIEGVQDSAHKLSNNACAALLEVWRKRRAKPELLEQPREQWPDRPTLSSRDFNGYRPESIPFNIDTLVSSPTFVRRLKTAALDSGARKKWVTFD